MFYLYVKQHSVTGLKYFGFTIQKDPVAYKGSGKYWTKHIKKHGREFVETIELWSFPTKQEAWEFAREYSEQHNIVESKDWANLKPEGLDGGRMGEYGPERSAKLWETRRKNNKPNILIGRAHSEERRANIASTVKKQYEEGRERRKPAIAGQQHTEEARAKMSVARKGRESGAKGKTWKRNEDSNKKLSESCKGRKKLVLPNGKWTWIYPKTGGSALSQ